MVYVTPLTPGPTDTFGFGWSEMHGPEADLHIVAHQAGIERFHYDEQAKCYRLVPWMHRYIVGIGAIEKER